MKKFLITSTGIIFLISAFIPAAIKADAATPRAAISLAPKAPITLSVRVTAYTSTVNQTDDTPFITANGQTVRDGIVATNMLPFGTKIKIPSLFGDKVFTVEDRMNKRMKNGLDIWMSSRSQALKFGVGYATIVVVSN